MPFSTQAILKSLKEFEASQISKTFERCAKTITERRLGDKHFKQMLDYVEAKKAAAYEAIEEGSDTCPGEVNEIFSYMSTDPDNLDYCFLVGLTVVADRDYFRVMERRFPMELNLRQVAQAHYAGSGLSIQFKTKAFNFMNALGISLSEVLQEEDGLDAPTAMVLPGLRGLYTGQAESEEASVFKPFQHIQIQRGQGAAKPKDLTTISIADQKAMVSIDGFFAHRQFSQMPTPAAQAAKEIWRMYEGLKNELGGDVYDASFAYFAGGIDRTDKIFPQHRHVQDGTERIRQNIERTKDGLRRIVRSNAWGDFASRQIIEIDETPSIGRRPAHEDEPKNTSADGSTPAPPTDSPAPT